MALSQFGAWTPDLPDLVSGAAEALNVIPYADHYRPLPGLEIISSALPGQPYAAISTSVVGGVSETYAATVDMLYQLVGNTWTDRSGGVYLTETPMNWDMVQYRDRVLAFSITNLAQQVLIGSATNFASITDSPMGRVAGVVRDFVFVGDINDPTDGFVPERVRWNAIDDPLTWPLPGTALAEAEQADENDLKAERGAVTGIFGSEIGIIMQERGVTRATYIGAPLVFQFDEVETSRGLITRGAGAQVGRTVFYLAEDGFFANDGSGESQPIGYGKVDQWFYENLNPALLYQVRATHDPGKKIVYWTFPSLASSTNDSVLIYNYRDQKWSHAEVGTSFAVSARSSGYTLDDLDAFGTLETLAVSLDSAFWAGGQTLAALFTDSFELASLTGDALPGTIETMEVRLDGRRPFVSGVRPLVEGGDAQIALGTRKLIKDSVTWTNLRSITASTGVVDFRSSEFFMRVRAYMPSGFTKAIGVDTIELKDDGGR